MSITVTLTFSIRPDRVDEFRSLLENLLPDTRAYDGCLNVDVYQDQDSPGTITLLEDWSSKQHQQKYQTWRDESGIADVLEPFLAGKPSFSYIDRLDI